MTQETPPLTSAEDPNPPTDPPSAVAELHRTVTAENAAIAAARRAARKA